MPPLKILLYPDPRLRKKSAPAEKIGGGIHALLDGMFETMRAARGVGLSAPQVGENIRVVLVSDARGCEPDGEEERELPQMPVIEMINPVMERFSGSSEEAEGCLSIPGFSGRVRRSEKVSVRWLDRDGKSNSMTADGLTARIVQHEIDHLDGTLFVDRLSGLKKQMMLKKMEKALGSARSSSAKIRKENAESQ